MFFDHKVKYKGVWYMPGEEIKGEEKSSSVSLDKKQYTKSEIMRMSISDLRDLATSEEIDGVADLKGADLKAILINKFGL